MLKNFGKKQRYLEDYIEDKLLDEIKDCFKGELEMTSYRLCPPFLYSLEEDDFSKVWEVFCLKLLKAEMRTDEIERRMPPESGVDLYEKENQTAYQCKSVIKDSKFNITKVKKSIDSALNIKNTLPWREYVVCSNVNLTEKQITEIKNYNRSISINIKAGDYWVGLCEKFPIIVERNFRKIVEVPYSIIDNDFDVIISPEYNKIKEKLKNNIIHILFYSSKHDKLYKLKVSSQITVSDLLILLRNFLKLDDVFKLSKGEISIKDSIIIDNKNYGYNEKTIGEIGIKEGSIVYYCLKYRIANHSESILQCNPDESEYDTNNLEKNIFSTFDEKIRKASIADKE